MADLPGARARSGCSTRHDRVPFGSACHLLLRVHGPEPPGQLAGPTCRNQARGGIPAWPPRKLILLLPSPNRLKFPRTRGGHGACSAIGAYAAPNVVNRRIDPCVVFTSCPRS